MRIRRQLCCWCAYVREEEDYFRGHFPGEPVQVYYKNMAQPEYLFKYCKRSRKLPNIFYEN